MRTVKVKEASAVISISLATSFYIDFIPRKYFERKQHNENYLMLNSIVVY